MLLTTAAKRQATFPAQVLLSLGANMVDKTKLVSSPAVYLLRTRVVNYSRLSSLRKKNTAPAQDFDIYQFRESKY